MRTLRQKPVYSFGFSMIEVVIAIGILMTLTIAVSTMLRSGIDVRMGLSQKAMVVQRMNRVISMISKDLEHSFIVSSKDQLRNGIGRRTKGYFFIKEGSKSYKLALTTMTHESVMAGAKEGDMSFVVYELKESKTASGRTNLVRGNSKIVPTEFNEDPKGEIIAEHIKSIKFEVWRGDKWMKDGWDTERSDYRDKLPRMVKITVEAWLEDREDSDGSDDSQIDQATDSVSTVVYIPASAQFAEMKEQDSSIRWESF